MLESITPEIIVKAQKGDSGVLAELYEHYHEGIFRYLYYRVGDLQAAEDLAADVFLKMISGLDDYQHKNVAFEAWLFQIARNHAIDHYRKMRVRNHLPLEDKLVAENIDVDKTVEHSLTSDVLVKALRKLNDAQRDVIVLRFVNCLPIAHVAQTLHKSEDSVKALQRRGLEALRTILLEWEVAYVR